MWRLVGVDRRLSSWSAALADYACRNPSRRSSLTACVGTRFSRAALLPASVTSALRRPWPWALAVAVLAVVTYRGALHDGFVMDDNAAILRNPIVTGPFSPLRVFATDFWGRAVGVNRYTETYRPLTALTLAVDWNLAGGRPWWFHLSNVLMHACAAALVLRVAWGRFGSKFAAVAAGAVFAVHTLHTDAVTSIVGRADVLSLLGILVTYALHGRDDRVGRLGAPLGLLAGLLAKESSLLVLPLVAMRDAREGVPLVQWPRRYAGYAAAIALCVAARWRVLGGLRGNRVPSALRNPLFTASPPEHLVTSLRLFGRAVKLTMAPLDLLPDYSPGAVVPSVALDGDVALGVGVIALLVGLVVWSWRRRHPFGDAALWVLTAGLAAVNLPVLLPRAFAERWWYVASAGACVLFGAGLARVRHRLGLAPATLTLALIVVALSWLTDRRNAVWENDETLFHDAASLEPNLAFAQVGLAEQRLRYRNYREARLRCERAARVLPRWSEPWACLASVAERTGQPERAADYYARMNVGEGLSGDRRLQYVRFIARRDPAAGLRALDAMERDGPWTPFLQRAMATLRAELRAR
mgnify:CR=1 FL=1